jgi:UDP-N-acetylglucosamine--N-acetylmuramyl-(pentapeptide) pyrophosphoryl-undecaprenol N-acetylglucosamine transferase
VPSQAPLKVLIAGGGTGGHVIPALAIGRALRDRHGADVLYVGTARGVETKLVPEAGFRLELVRSGQLKNVSLMTRLKTATDLPLGVVHCVGVLRRFKPQVVVGVGGYASGPAMLAAVMLRVPCVVYEPNAVPGMTNRWLGRFVQAAAVSFAHTAKYFRGAVITGVPVRPEMFAIQPKTDGPPRLLVTAGSNGALIFNEMMPRIVVRLQEAVPGLTIVHQAGARRLLETRTEYAESGADLSRVECEAFLSDMPAQFAAADVVLSRSGSTVAELAAAGRPSLLVPLPTAADDHQRRNAEILVQAGAALMMLQKDVSEDTLFTALRGLLVNPAQRTEMGAYARTLARPGALDSIVALVLRVAGYVPADTH